MINRFLRGDTGQDTENGQVAKNPWVWLRATLHSLNPVATLNGVALALMGLALYPMGYSVQVSILFGGALISTGLIQIWGNWPPAAQVEHWLALDKREREERARQE